MISRLSGCGEAKSTPMRPPSSEPSIDSALSSGRQVCSASTNALKVNTCAGLICAISAQSSQARRK